MDVYLWVVFFPRTLKKSRCDGWSFTFTDPVQPLSLHFVFVGQGHGVKRSTAQDSTAQRGSSPQPQILPRFRLLVHCQLYSPGHNASVHTPEGKKKQKHKDTRFTRRTKYCCESGTNLSSEGFKESLTTKSIWLTKRCRQQIRESHLFSHTSNQPQLVTKRSICSESSSLFLCCLKCVFHLSTSSNSSLNTLLSHCSAVVASSMKVTGMPSDQCEGT